MFQNTFTMNKTLIGKSYSFQRAVKRLAGAAVCSVLLISVACAHISGTVFCDANGNGTLDAGEAGIPGVKVTLCNQVKVTDANGFYFFSSSDLNTAGEECYPTWGAAPPYYVSVDVTSVTGSCNVRHCPTSVMVPSVPADNVNFCFVSQSPPSNPGTGTPGYWKNHPEAWPINSIILGGVTYTKAQAIAIMNLSTKSDKTLNMAEQLIAAKLNVLIGNDSTCIASTIASADAFLTIYPIGSKVTADSSAWQLGSPVHTTLDNYNNGLLCAPHRD
jgi:hypothetical protein